MSGPKPGRQYSLEEAIAGAQAAGRHDRIEWRDAIAVHGPAAVDAAFEWVGDAEFGFFAVRVIEAAAKYGALAEALDALISLRSIGASADVRREADAAIARLKPLAPRHAAYRRSQPIPASAGIDWPGFKPEEFGNVEGTTWRRSTDGRSLVPLLLRPLQEARCGHALVPDLPAA